MDQSSGRRIQDGLHDGDRSERVSLGERVRKYGIVLIFAGPLYLAAGAGGETIGAAMTGEQGLHNLLPAGLAMYILHRCFWD